jgi:hypothetical protein
VQALNLLGEPPWRPAASKGFPDEDAAWIVLTNYKIVDRFPLFSGSDPRPAKRQVAAYENLQWKALYFLSRRRRWWRTMSIHQPGVAFMTSQHLTKSRYIAGLQCLRRLWLIDHEPAPYEEPAAGSPLDIERQIGHKAHLLFPGGALVDEEPWRHVAAIARTAALMATEQVPAIFEAAFEYDNIRIRVDVLERLAHGTWGLHEVKSSGGPKDHYYDDIALQAFVLEGAGIVVTNRLPLAKSEKPDNGISYMARQRDSNS